MGNSGAAILLVVALCLVLALAGWERARYRAVQSKFLALDDTHQAAVRLIRLAAADQRSIGLTLIGLAETCEAQDSITGLARRLIDLSENLTEETEQPDAPRHLHEEEITLLPVIEFAVAQVSAHLGTGNRSWRLSPDLRRTRVLADRRAICQVLVNVLSGAAATTRNGDLIELSTERSKNEWSLVVQDEGVGLPVAANETGKTSGRGIGLRLTLARSLMQAHEGALTVESAEQIGTRVRLSFPVRRVVA